VAEVLVESSDDIAVVFRLRSIVLNFADMDFEELRVAIPTPREILLLKLQLGVLGRDPATLPLLSWVGVRGGDI
jgi:hypothetical protein